MLEEVASAVCAGENSNSSVLKQEKTFSRGLVLFLHAKDQTVPDIVIKLQWECLLARIMYTGSNVHFF